MLTEMEQTIVNILKELQIDWESIIGIMLMLKENETGQHLLVQYLQHSNNKKITTSDIVLKVEQIIGN